MRLDKKIASTELQTARVSAAYFGRLVDISAMRVGQLIREGLLIADVDGVQLLPSLRRYYGMKAYCWRGGNTVEDYVRRFNEAGERRA